MIENTKYLLETFDFIAENTKQQKFKIKMGQTKNHPLNNKEISLSKSEDKYLFDITIPIEGKNPDIQFDRNRETQVELTNTERTIFLKGKSILPSNISYSDFSSEIVEKYITGQITSLSTKRMDFYKSEKFYRMIIPLNRNVKLYGDFTGFHHSVDGKPKMETLVQLFINNIEFHFFTYVDSNNSCFFIIDSLDKILLDVFKATSNSILLAYAFLKGDYHGRETIILSYGSKSFKKPSGMLSIILGGGIYNGFAVHSTKPYSLVSLNKKRRYKKDASGNIIGFNDSNLKKYMKEFPSECLSKLCELICNKGGILRAVILFVSNHSAALELKMPTLFVALENVTKVLIGGDTKTPMLIEDDQIIQEIKPIIKKTVKEIDEIERKYRPHLLSKDELKEYKATYARIRSKLHDFNKGTNNKKLVEPFINFNYELSPEEKELIMTFRNKFLHGEDFLSLDIDYEVEFKELFHMSMRLQKLIAVLLLKASDYSGYILNNAKIYDYISERNLKEKVFVKI